MKGSIIVGGTYFGIGCAASVSFGSLSMDREDGYGDGVLVYQGPRAYDPDAGTWTTPDAYQGSLDDPISQRPYMWNRNNPMEYSDPSGYDGCKKDNVCNRGGSPAAAPPTVPLKEIGEVTAHSQNHALPAGGFGSLLVQGSGPRVQLYRAIEGDELAGRFQCHGETSNWSKQ